MSRVAHGWGSVGLVLLFGVVSSLLAAAEDVLVDSGQCLGNEASWSVALGDVDGDGDLDAVVANLDVGASVWRRDPT